jgi:2-polyprenyl-3-methyl-5-hydroxy-6-metoxy-1,4-benzoquinol methylase
MKLKENVNVFNQDVKEGSTYKYTAEGISKEFSNSRTTREIRELTQWSGKNVLDMGCGDGTFTYTLIENGAASVLGLDPASVAIEKAKENSKGIANLKFEVGSIYELDKLGIKFDTIVLRGVLHHVPDAAAAVMMAAKVADEIIIMEPNGLNPILKIIEKVSPYHRLHEEQSFFPSTIRKWCSDAGFITTKCNIINLVPLFCPDGLAKFLKKIEPMVERIPIFRNFACGQVLLRATKNP